MEYLVKYYTKSKYIGCVRCDIMEFKTMDEVLDFIIENKIKEYTIYKKYVIVN